MLPPRNVRCSAAAIAFALAASLFPLQAFANDVVVTKRADTNDGVCDADCSLREAIAAANPGDTIVIPFGAFQVNSELMITKSLTLQGAGAATTIIQAAAQPGIAGHRIFNLSASNIDVSLLDMTIRYGAVLDSSASAGAILGSGSGGSLQITRCNVVFNQANASTPTDGGAADGGAIFYDSGPLTITDSTIAFNEAIADGGTRFGGAAAGGAIFSGTTTIIRSTVAHNRISVTGPIANGAASGGGVFTGALVLTNSTITGNSMLAGAGSGAGIFGQPNVSSSTITDNTIVAGAASGGGIFGLATIRDTIIAGNTPDDCNGPVTSDGYNLIDDGSSCPFAPATGDQIGTSGSPINPLLGPLSLNGGPTQTRALLRGSPAIDAGNPSGCLDDAGMPLQTDQTGFTRVFDGNNDGTAICDIGAYEYRPEGHSAPALGWLGMLVLAATLSVIGFRRLA